MKSAASILFGLAAVLAGGCQATAPTSSTPDPAPVAPVALAPMDVDGAHETNWAYLVAKYDADGDGRITADEHGRGADVFERLDQDGDGVLTGADSGSRGGRGSGNSARMAQRMTSTYFQDDADPDTAVFALAELETSVDAYDANGDGVVDRSEFEAFAAIRRVDPPGNDAPAVRRMMNNIDGYAVIVEAVDDDGDEAIGRDELIAFFHARDDGDGVWTLTDPFGGRRGRRGGAPDGAEPTTGPKVGTLAPDFELRAPDGGPTVTLSSFRGNLPVALIFGSYT